MSYELDFKEVGNRIRLLREFLGYTRDYLAEQLGVSTKFCRDIEIGAEGMSLQTLNYFALLTYLVTLSFFNIVIFKLIAFTEPQAQV